MAGRAETQPVLIIEDDQNTAHLVSLYLDREGFKSVIAHDGREGLKLAQAFNRMADSLQKIEQLRKSMTIDVAHELRTPLTNIQGYLEALIDGVVSASRETYELLLDETMRLVRLVEDILQLAKADAARADLQKERILLKELVQRVIDSYRSRFDQKGIGIEMQFHQSADAVRADPARLAQVMRNLIQNAWQYTPPGGALRICTELQAVEIRFFFRIPVEKSPKKTFHLFSNGSFAEKNPGRAGTAVPASAWQSSRS